MSDDAHIEVLNPGFSSAIQGAPYRGMRSVAMPAAGAADPLSLALANRLVGKPASAPAIEITLTEAAFRVTVPQVVAVGGAASMLLINGVHAPAQYGLRIQAGDRITVGSARRGARSYLAFSGAFDLPERFGTASTYAPAGLGGLDGRALQKGDRIAVKPTRGIPAGLCTPVRLRPRHGHELILRYVPGPEHDWLSSEAQTALKLGPWLAGQRLDRMGIGLEGAALTLERSDSLNSGPVFPGTVQCPPSGQPIILGPDAQTSGGYPRIAQIIRADRHLIGQINPRSALRLLPISPMQARQTYRDKLELWRSWLPDLRLD